MSKKNPVVEDFFKEFSEKRVIIGKSIEELKNTDDDGNQIEINSKLTEIQNSIQDLKSSLHATLSVLPPYSVKVRQDEITDLEKHLKLKEDELVPKKKFGFKSKAVKPAEVVAVEKVKPELSEIKLQQDNDNFMTIQDLENVTVSYEENQLNGNDVLIKNLANVCVKLNGSPSTLRISNLKNCRLICGPVKTSIFIEHCNDSKLYLCCQQLRTHSSEDLDIYLYVKSRAIIEDCSKIGFAPYTWDHSNSATEELFKQADMDPKCERFEFIDDFNWLANNSQSPNWSIIKPEDRIQFS